MTTPNLILCHIDTQKISAEALYIIQPACIQDFIFLQALIYILTDFRLFCLLFSLLPKVLIPAIIKQLSYKNFVKKP